MPTLIRTIDPDTAAYARDYANGFRVGEQGAEGALESADSRGVSHAWYDGYHDAAASRPKWTYRRWRRNGPQCDSGCAFDCDGTHA